jgi:hypothetical protein
MYVVTFKVGYFIPSLIRSCQYQYGASSKQAAVAIAMTTSPATMKTAMEIRSRIFISDPRLACLRCASIDGTKT